MSNVHLSFILHVHVISSHFQRNIKVITGWLGIEIHQLGELTAKISPNVNPNPAGTKNY